VPKPSATGSTYEGLMSICHQYGASLVAVSKTRTEKEILELYKRGQRAFGENRAHELIIKAELLPTDIEWHLIGHLQTNKVKPVIKYAQYIQSLDSLKLWQKIQEEAKEAEVNIKCLLQIKIASEETKYGWQFEELDTIMSTGQFQTYSNVEIAGVMGMASLTEDVEQVHREFKQLKNYYDLLKEKYFKEQPGFSTISMGMSSDYLIALEEGSNMIRIGSLLFEH
jgi:PLP dependent protein